MVVVIVGGGGEGEGDVEQVILKKEKVNTS